MVRFFFRSLALIDCYSKFPARSCDRSGFAIFFAIFDISRQLGVATSHAIESVIIRQPWTLASIRQSDYKEKRDERLETMGEGSKVIRTPTVARVAQGFVLVAGGGEQSASVTPVIKH